MIPGYDLFEIIGWKIILFVVVVCVIRAYLKGTQYRGHEKAKGKVAIVTGASVGIGKQIVRELNFRGAKVYLLCRDKQRGEDAISHLVQNIIFFAPFTLHRLREVKREVDFLGCNPTRLLLQIVDLASFKTIRAFAAHFNNAEEKLDILVNNAGIMLYPKFRLTEDGHELTWQTNYLGHFLLTELVTPKLSASPSARIVNVSALAHFYSDPIDLNSIDRREGWDSRQAYARSKLAQVMHSVELTRRLRSKGSHITINSCHPGIVYTRLMRYTPLQNNALMRTTLAPLCWFLLKTAKDGAQCPLYLALSKEVEGVSAKYFKECGPQDASDTCKDEENCALLYEQSLEDCGLAQSQDVEKDQSQDLEKDQSQDLEKDSQNEDV